MRDAFMSKSAGAPIARGGGQLRAHPAAHRVTRRCVGAFRSFQYVLTTEAQLAALAECRWVLRPGWGAGARLLRPGLSPAAARTREFGSDLSQPAFDHRRALESREVDRVAQRVDVTFRSVEGDLDGVLADVSATYGVRYTFPVELSTCSRAPASRPSTCAAATTVARWQRGRASWWPCAGSRSFSRSAAGRRPHDRDWQWTAAPRARRARRPRTRWSCRDRRGLRPR